MGETDKADALDARDIARVLAGDTHAFSPLVERHGSAIAKQMRHYSDDPLVIEELTSDVFVEAYLGLAGFKGLSPFRHWLARIASRTGYKYWKRRDKQKREVPLTALDESRSESVNGQPDPETVTALVYELLAELSDEDRLVLTLMFLENCSHREIAKRMGWSTAIVAMRVVRAKRKLRKIGQQETWKERLSWIPL
ncbi:MAG: sigma-70 family RNA polymerase sigma factor [Planctomycetaceae bacterium]|nr:sigma-70 family RNA polymerase sigma factor [Planctomycetaceae bacterium]